MGLIVALDDNGKAEGQMFWDDGHSIGEYELFGVPKPYLEKPRLRASGYNWHKPKTLLISPTVNKVMALGEFLQLFPAVIIIEEYVVSRFVVQQSDVMDSTRDELSLGNCLTLIDSMDATRLTVHSQWFTNLAVLLGPVTYYPFPPK